MAQVKIAEINPQYKVAIFTTLVRQEFAIAYASGAVRNFISGEYRKYLVHDTKKLHAQLMQAIDLYHAWVRSLCVGGTEDAENVLDCSITFQNMLKEPLKYLEHLNARLILKAGYGHQTILTKLSVAHILMDITAYITGVYCRNYPNVTGLRTIGGLSPSSYGSCTPPESLPNSFATMHRMLAKFNTSVLKRMGYGQYLRYDLSDGSEESRIFQAVQTMLADKFCDQAAICALSQGMTAEEALEESRRIRKKMEKETEKQKRKEQLKEAKKSAKHTA